METWRLLASSYHVKEDLLPAFLDYSTDSTSTISLVFLSTNLKLRHLLLPSLGLAGGLSILFDRLLVLVNMLPEDS